MPEPLNFDISVSSENQFIAEFPQNISLYLKREDLLHPEVSGNKFRKIKYNLKEALRQNKGTLLTFGGAFSNHITATAAAGKIAGIKTIGVIRGEELGEDLLKTLDGNPSLKFAHSCGMRLHFISRKEYREKTTLVFQQKLREEFGDFYLLPEGGTNDLAVNGCKEILGPGDEEFNYICCAVGTGGTISGIINASGIHQLILGFPALKGDFLAEEIRKYSEKNNWELILNYHFSGYAKVNSELINFINKFKKKYQIQLDPIYTGKLVFGIFDQIKRGKFPAGSKILAIHTGGLQGIEGVNKVLRKKNLPLIN
ncbi:1-aminocyclopropane-1-carboxylate deaminase/D-cysteine desulfhydrase [Salegentibacter flavus]|uniref:1-aminocyclopropane-1-carboxylate deaminase n=1 Tax=Salegentibacter flavus TaxID=287099 RepID=A0A1I5B5Z6_9FLAO|nr:pyridoxal-phosphate dependent enzyme [Salegentibacter flavus]SFN70127.1 1-aminocyclopropane-1-carboxylate deaminase [Salegentibacter flavus]